MQFGKFHGLMLVAFGFLLFAVQTWIYFDYSIPPGENSASRQDISRSEEEHVSYLPAILGGLALTLGGVLLLVDQEKRIEKATRQLDADSQKSLSRPT